MEEHTKYTLKIIQYTPVLHFQKDAQAPIRATELKPKLDRFILAKYKVNDNFLIKTPNKGTKALNYKVSIVTEGCKRMPVTNEGGKPPMFFGDEKYPLMVAAENRIVTINFFSRNADVINLLKDLDWTSFFLSNNFGTRQDKGYGSFLPENANIETLTNKEKWHIISPDKGLRLDSYFTVSSPANQWEAVMKRIENVAKCMRSGINSDEIYCKSLMFAYAGKKHSDGKRYFWDKRFIKEKFYKEVVKAQHEEHPNSEELKEKENSGKEMEPYLFRDYLGLSTIEVWGKHYNSKIYKKAQIIKDKNKDKNREVIARFKSPLLFKPVYLGGQWYIFLLHKEIPQKFKQAKVTVKEKVSKKNKDTRTSVYDNKVCQMKPFHLFSMADYLNFVFNKDMQYSHYMAYKSIKGKKSKDNGDKINNDFKHLQKNQEKIEEETDMLTNIITDFECLKNNYKTIVNTQ